MRVEISLLGGFAVRLDDRTVPEAAWERRHAATLVKLLALAPARQMHREQCIDALWPDLPLDEAAPRLHKAAHYARKATGARDAVVLRHDSVALFPGHEVVIDVAVFEDLANRATEQGDSDALQAAVDAYAGALLPADMYEEWADGAREHARQTYLALLRRAGRWTALVAEEPADEEAHLALMREHVARGDGRSAIRQFERMDRALRDELGVAPGAAAVRLRDEVLDLLAVPTPAPTVATSLVARDRELAICREALRTAGGGRRRVLLITGAAGVGKTALVEAVRAEATGAGWRVAMGAAAAIEGAWPYAPVLEAVADLSRRHPTLLDGLDDRFRTEIESARRGVGAAKDPRRDVRPGAPDTHAGHQRLFLAVAELVRIAASGTGLVIVVDDLHEADDASLRLLHFLARSTTDERVLFVLTSRTPAHAPPFDEFRASLTRRDALTEIALAPLDRDGTRALLTRLGADGDDARLDRVWAISGGIPFVVTQVASGDDGLMLSALDARTRDALQRVAVTGSAFDTDEFVALSALADEDAYDVLDRALAAGVVERTDLGYRIRHSLIRDALLADLAPHRRRLVHRDAAERLQAIGASPARVGHHLLAAGEPAAVPYLITAAEAEARVGAYRDALELVDATRPHASPAQHFRLATLRGDLLFAIGDPRAIASYREAVASTTDGTQRRLTLAKLARAAIFAGDIELAGSTLSNLEAAGDEADAIIALTRAHHAYFSGDIAAASGQLERADVAGVDTDTWQFLDVVALRGLIAHDRGEWFEQLGVELRRTVDAPDLARSVFDGHLCVAEYLLYGPVPYEEVRRLATSLRATAKRAGALRAVGFATTLLGEAALLGGDLATAERELQDAVDLHREIGATAGEATSLQRLAEVRLAAGNQREARALLERALPLARWSMISRHLVQRVLGTMVRAAPTVDAARAVVDAADASLAGDDFCPYCQVMYAVPAAIACADHGDLAAAERHLATAERSARLWRGTAWSAALLEARAHLLLARERPGEALDLLGQAADRFDLAGQPLDAERCRATSVATG